MDERDAGARPPNDDRAGNDLPARSHLNPEALPSAESEEPVGPPLLPRVTSRRRVLRALGIGAMVLLVLALAFPVLANASIDLRTLLHIPTPTPTTTLSPSTYQFSWVDGVPWGELQVDGRPGPDVHQPLGQTAEGLPVLPSFTLPRGRHTLRYVAELFPPLTCTVSVPAAQADTCPLSREAVSPDPALAGRSGRVLDLQATVERLPAEQRTALEQTIQALLTASEASATVAPGARYLGADGQVKVATQVLRARPQYTLNEDPRYLQAGLYSPCVTLCLLPSLDLLGPDIWGLVGHVVVHWHYARTDGQVVLDQAPAAPIAQDEHVGVWLAVQWTGHWQVQFWPLLRRQHHSKAVSTSAARRWTLRDSHSVHQHTCSTSLASCWRPTTRRFTSFRRRWWPHQQSKRWHGSWRRQVPAASPGAMPVSRSRRSRL